jgi:myo-inositol 2-dehydrogenase / D-chiro-inositol 1-dehydrogenase
MTRGINKSKGRRRFIGDAALGIAGAMGAGYLLSSCSSGRSRYEAPVFYDTAPDGPVLKAGLIGCGGRGTGAAFNFLNAGPNLQITAIGDVFQHRLDNCRQTLKDHMGVEIADANCFTGFDSYQRVIDSDVDIILHVTPQHFRPRQFEAAVQARKHIFVEKPAGVDPVGVRSVMAAGRMAEAAGLVVVAGTNFRHQRDYLTTHAMVKTGIIGDLVSANAYDIRGKIWHVNRQQGWSDMEAMLRDWMNWYWLSGGDNVDIAVHQIDMISMYFGKFPVKALGMGGRHRRPTGDVYDYYSIEYEFDDGKTFECKTRCIDGCDNKHGFMIFGTKGYTNCRNKIWDYDDILLWEYEYPLDSEGRPTNRVAISSYDEEHINFVTAIRNKTPLNQTYGLAAATMVGIMGRESAITGREVTWDDMMASSLQLGPSDYSMGSVPGIAAVPPVPGTAPDIARVRSGW